MACAEFTTVFTNSLMPQLVPPSQLGRLSGIGWGVGYAGGLVSLIVISGLLVANPATGKTLLGLDPLLNLNAAAREGDRLVGPFAAAWLLVFILPFFIFTPDACAPTQKKSMSAALGELWHTVKGLPAHPAMLLFLLARAIFADGLSAIFVFGGIYGTTVFDWQAFERGLFGIILILASVFGAVMGGFLDDRIGAKRVILGSLVILMFAAVGILSVDKGHVLYTIAVPAKVAGGSIPFASIGEMVFLSFAIMVSLVAAPVGASSRSLLARLAPPDKMAQFFGLFAFSGKATAFMAPLMVAFVTDYTHSQRFGMASILAFLMVGFVMMLAVKERREEI
jgi:UMF1 family MFS transporter